MSCAIRVFALLAATGLMWLPSLSGPALAAGTEFSFKRHDLSVQVDSRWVGGRWGGYYPLRVRLVNVGKSRELTFRFRPSQPSIPEVRRTLHVEQNATERFTLSIPLVGPDSNGTFSIEEFGSPLSEMSRGIVLPDLTESDSLAPALLVISPQEAVLEPFHQAVSAVLTAEFQQSPYQYFGIESDDATTIPPGNLPESWIDYSGLDLIAVPQDVFATLSRPVRAALLAWAECGGTLLIFNAPPEDEERKKLDEALGWAGASAGTSASRRAWQPASPERPDLNFYDENAEDEFSTFRPQLEQAREAARRAARRRGLPEATIERVFGGLFEDDAPDVRRQANFPHWPTDADAFHFQSYGFGKIYAVPGDLRYTSREDWAWLLTSIGRTHFHFPTRLGNAPRFPNEEFSRFRIPGVGDVPVIAYLFLMTLFSLFIGPVNYFWMRHKKQLHWLIVTIPAIALVTSLSLFGYSALSHGFGVKSRLRSVTLIDADRPSAVTICRTSLYAGLTSSENLKFSRQTAVLPVWLHERKLDESVVDWTETQEFDRSWLPPRTRTQFLTVHHRPMRGRLSIGPPRNGAVEVRNGLEWALESVIVVGSDGVRYAGADVPAGGVATLKPANDDHIVKFSTLLHSNTPEVADADEGVPPGVMFDFRLDYYMDEPSIPASFVTSLLEQAYNRAAGYSSGTTAEPLTFAAFIRRPADLDAGLADLDVRQESHLLLGRMSELHATETKSE